MGTKYSTILVGGVVQTYADNSPSDDGSQVEANRVKFATITSDLTAPLHSAITRMDAALLNHVDEGPTAKATAYTTVAGDHNSVIECSGSFILSLLNPSGNAGYQVTVKNAGSGTITVNVDGGANVDGASSVTLQPGEAGEYRVNAAGNAYYSTAGPVAAGMIESGTKMLFYQDTAPAGWTIDTAPDEHAVRLTKGTGASGEEGGTTGGTNNFSTQFAALAEGASPGVGDHTLTAAQSGVPAHTHSVTPQVLTNSGATGTSGGGAGFTNATASANTPADAASGHSHTVDLRVKWAACIIATKD